MTTDNELLERVEAALAEALGEAMDCTREWGAWFVGTMTQNDFVLVADDQGRLNEIAEAVILAIKSAPTDTST